MVELSRVMIGLKNKVRATFLALFFILIAIPVTSFAVAPVVEDDNFIEADLQSWNQITFTTPLSPNKKVLGYMEVQPRVSLLGPDKPGPVAVLIVRPAVGYQLTQSLSVWQGYAWVPSFEDGMVNENRLWQQVLWNSKIKNLDVINRTRLEQRFIDGAGGTSVRARHMLRGVYPLGKSKKWSAVAYDELFINLNSTPAGPEGGFDQNRTFVGINRKLNEYVNMEAGYMANLIDFRGLVRLNHIILFTLNFRAK